MISVVRSYSSEGEGEKRKSPCSVGSGHSGRKGTLNFCHLPAMEAIHMNTTQPHTGMRVEDGQVK